MIGLGFLGLMFCHLSSAGLLIVRVGVVVMQESLLEVQNDAILLEVCLRDM